MNNSLIFSIFLIFSGAALLSTLALFTRQSLLVAYMVLGMLFGPWALKLASDAGAIAQISDVGIIFLLFLLGLHLQPQNLIHMLRKVTWVALISSILFLALGFGVGYFFNYTYQESLVMGAAAMFSSTIIGLKLLPTRIMHHQHIGEVMISVLLMQDLIAIVALLILHGASTDGGITLTDVGIIVLGFPALCLFAYLVERYVLLPLYTKFDQIHEYVFLISIGWCLGMAELANFFGLSHEIGAFIAGVSIAASPIALYIAESLKPLRDFFLVMFFFTVGAGFNFSYLPQIALPAIIFAALLLLFKPFVFSFLLHKVSETKRVAWEVGVRLAQGSEFSLLLVAMAASSKVIGDKATYLIQATTIITFIISSYWVVLRFPTPLGLTERMRRD